MNLPTSNSEFAAILRSLGIKLIAGALILGVSCGVLSQVFRQPNWKTMAIDQLETDTKVLILGSSHVFFGIDPRVMPQKTVNLSANYLHGIAMDQLIHTHLEKTPRCELILLELDLPTILFDGWRMNPKGLVDLGLSPLGSIADWTGEFDTSLRRLLYPIFSWRLTPKFYQRHKKSRFANQEIQSQVAGYVPSDIEVTFAERSARYKVERFQKELHSFSSSLPQENLAALKRVTSELKERGVQVAFFRPPLLSTVRHIYPKNWEQQLADAIDQLSAFDFKDYSHAPDFENRHFRDPEHLNTAGAKLFSQMLAQDFMTP